MKPLGWRMGANDFEFGRVKLSRAREELRWKQQESEEMNQTFEVPILNEEGKFLARGLAKAFDEHLQRVQKLVGRSDGREMALVVTHLELANDYAKKAMASLLEHQAEGGQ